MGRKKGIASDGPIFAVREMKLISGNANLPLARKISRRLGLPLAKVKVERFADGEIQVRIEESVRGQDVFIIQPTCHPVNENLMELLIIMDALRRASARRVYPVIPYYGYSRQDKKIQPREPISARLVANLIEVSGAHRVLSLDLHSYSIQGFFNIPVDHLTAVNLLVRQMHKNGLLNEKMIVVSPDVGGVLRASQVSNKIERFYNIKVPLAIIAKRRPEPNITEAFEVIGKVKGKIAVIFDDMIDTAGSICNGAEQLMDRGAEEVHVYATHGIFSHEAFERINKSGIKKVVVTDSIPIRRRSSKVEVVTASRILARAIKHCFEDQSVSQIFEDNFIE